MPFANVDGSKIYYREQGNGAPLVMLLPQSGGPVGVDPFLNALALRFRVITYDQRGTGRSDPVTTSDGMTMMGRSAEIVGLLNTLKIDQAHLCGHSTGCGIGIATTSAAPNRISRLILVNPWSHGDRHLITMQRLRIAAARALDPYRYTWFNASLLFPPMHRREHAAAFEQLALEAAPQDANQIEARLEAIIAFDARPLASNLNCPSLVATAADDQLMPAWIGADLAGLIPDATLLALDGGGHMLPETRGLKLAAEISTFLTA